MSKYYIHEDNIERLEKNIRRIERKCKKLGCSFTYNKVDEIFKEVDCDGRKVIAKFIGVEVDGVAKLNDWEFVGEVEHTEHGNLIRQCGEYEVPERYYKTDVVCEHCNTVRKRKSTFLVRNSVSGEFKQVGKSCLKVFTNGLDAEWMASYLSMFDELAKFDSVVSSGYSPRYYDTKKVLAYACELVRCFGYVKSAPDELCDDVPTKSKTLDYIRYYECGGDMFCKYVRSETPDDFNVNSDEVEKLVCEILEYFKNNEDDSEYMHNLQVLSNLPAVSYKHFGYVVSMIPTYKRAIQKISYQKQVEANKKLENVSTYVGSIGSKVTVKVNAWKCLCSYSNVYGISSLYQFSDVDGNIFIWSTSKSIKEELHSFELTGTVKDHSEYNGVKQTKLTRCKIVY